MSAPTGSTAPAGPPARPGRGVRALTRHFDQGRVLLVTMIDLIDASRYWCSRPAEPKWSDRVARELIAAQRRFGFPSLDTWQGYDLEPYPAPRYGVSAVNGGIWHHRPRDGVWRLSTADRWRVAAATRETVPDLVWPRLLAVLGPVTARPWWDCVSDLLLPGRASTAGEGTAGAI